MSGAVTVDAVPYASQDALGGIERIYDGLGIVLRGCPLDVLQASVFDTLVEFCTRSRVWRMQFNWTMTPGVAILSFNQVSASVRATSLIWVTGLPRFQVQQPAVLLDCGDTTVQRAGSVLVSCIPQGLGSLPSFLVDDWSEALRYGALFRLYGMPSKPWSNPTLAQFNGIRFRSQINRAAAQARNNGDLPGPRFPYFANGRRGYAGCGAPGGTVPGVQQGGVPVTSDNVVDGNADPANPILDGGFF